MSTKQGKIGLHKFNGDPNRFLSLTAYVGTTYKGKVRYIADVAGGQGMLARILNKKYQFDAEVIDPRAFVLKGVKHKQNVYTEDMADYYDLLIGLHPDQALRPLVLSARIRPTIIIPCCNFWSDEETLGRDALLAKITAFYKQNNILYETVIFDFEGPKNIGLVSLPKKDYF